MANSNFRYDSSAPISYLGWSWEGNFTNTSRTFHHEFEHNLPFAPLLVGYYTTSYTGDTRYDISSFEGSTLIAPVVVRADSSKVYISGYDRSPNFVTISFKLTGFIPPEYTGDVLPIEDSSPLRFSSDYKYPQLFALGKLTATSAASMVMNHNLGFVPQTRTWLLHENGRVNAFNDTAFYVGGSGTCGTFVDDSKLTVYKNFSFTALESSPVVGAYYQIFKEDF